MKHIKSRLAFLAMFLVVAGPLRAEDDLPLKNCNFCHGVAFQGLAYAPRLAGQRPDYVVKELGDFQSHSRDTFYSQKYMWNAAKNVSPEEAHALAGYLGALPMRAAEDGNRDLVAEGRTIFDVGVPQDNVVACMACHGPDAQGIRNIPRLGGLSYEYLKRRLEQWGQGFHASATPMPKVARSLSPGQIDALASYLSFIDYESANR